MVVFNSLLKKVAASAALSMALTGAAWAQSDNADTPKPENPQNAIRPIERQQRHVGDTIRKSSDDLSDLIEDLHQSSLPDMDPSELNGANAKLDEIIQTHMPLVMRALIRARTQTADANADLRVSLKSSDDILKILQALTAAMKRDLQPTLTARALTNAITKVAEAQDKTRDTSLLHENLDSKPADTLTPEERAALRDAIDKQKDAAAEVKKTLAELTHQAETLAPTDKPAADAIRSTLADLNKADVQRNADGAHDDAADKKLHSAEKKNDDVLTALRNAEKHLAKSSDPVSDLEKHAAALNNAKGLQEKVMDDTRGLKPDDDKGIAGAMKDQGEVARALNDMKADNPALTDAANASKQAQENLGGDKPQSALKDQQRVLDAINSEIKSVASKIAQQSKNAPKKEGPMGQFAYDAVKTIASADWTVALPAKDRGDVEQAVKNKMPPKYARQIMLYYENLACAKPEGN